MSSLESVMRSNTLEGGFAAAVGRKLIRIATGANGVELIFERLEGEKCELLVDLDGTASVRWLDLAALESRIRRRYGRG